MTKEIRYAIKKLRLELTPSMLKRIIRRDQFEKAPMQPANINLINCAEKYCSRIFLSKGINLLR